MTGCMFFTPPITPRVRGGGVVPVLLADTLITWQWPLAPLVEDVLDADITPASVTWEHDGRRSRVTLGRKLHLVDAHCATALAGYGPKIREVLGTLTWNIDDWRSQGDSMSLYKQNADKYGGAVEVIGIDCLPEGRVSLAASFRQEHDDHLGLTTAIGKGGAQLTQLASAFRQELVNMADAPVMERLRGFAGAMNGERLAHEYCNIFRDGTGGYIEHAYYDTQQNSWRRGGSDLHIFYEILRDGDEIYANLLPKAIAYRPEGHGFVLGLTLELASDGEEVKRARVDGSQLSGETAEPIDGEAWRHWKPESATVTYFERRSAEKLFTTSRTLNRSEMWGVVFSLDGGFGLQPEVGDKLWADYQAFRRRGVDAA